MIKVKYYSSAGIDKNMPEGQKIKIFPEFRHYWLWRGFMIWRMQYERGIFTILDVVEHDDVSISGAMVPDSGIYPKQ